ncbi:MAG: TRAP transporter substrate-binding protein DctP [Gammaproteobacteria bacterium]
MTKKKITTRNSRLALAALVLWAAGSYGEEQRLSLVSSWSKPQNFNVLFLDYVNAVNEAGKGVVQIDFLGGPEVIPQAQLLYALRRGVIDLAFGAITYYRGVLPEGDAMFASSITPAQARRNGGFDALQTYWSQRINARLLGWMQSGVGVNIYLTDAPAFQPNGMPELAGLKIRTSPSNRELLTVLGARPVQIAVKEIYTALQRGTVDGLAFTTTGIPDLGIDEFIRYRIDPSFLQMAICLQINLDSWQQLSPAARKILNAQAIAYEPKGRADFFSLRDREIAELDKRGLQSAPVPGTAAAEYRNLAHEVVWTRLAARAPAAAKDLKPYFYPAAKVQ